jgi:hypothetical protein
VWCWGWGLSHLGPEHSPLLGSRGGCFLRDKAEAVLEDANSFLWMYLKGKGVRRGMREGWRGRGRGRLGKKGVGVRGMKGKRKRERD